MTALEIVGENVREIRKMQGFSLDSFARHSGLHKNYVGDLELGKRNLSVERLEQIAAALKVPVFFLLVEGSYRWAQHVNPENESPRKRGSLKSPKRPSRK